MLTPAGLRARVHVAGLDVDDLLADRVEAARLEDGAHVHSRLAVRALNVHALTSDRAGRKCRCAFLDGGDERVTSNGACRPSHRLLFVEVSDRGEAVEGAGAERAALGEGASCPDEDECAFHALTPFTLWPQLPAIP